MKKNFDRSRVYTEKEMTVPLLYETHPKYDEFKKEWENFKVAHNGGREYIEHALYQYADEDQGDYENRLKGAYVFNHNETIVDVYDFLLSEQVVTREWPDKLVQSPLFQMFLKDCDLQGTNYEDFVTDCHKLASVSGALGILVNKGMNQGGTEESAVRDGVYPYFTKYTLLNILDWEFTKDPVTHRRNLSFLKLRDDEDRFHIWYRGWWQTWEIINEPQTGTGGDPKLLESGENTLNKIPFFWFVNLKRTSHYYLGYSDLRGVVDIVNSIVRNCSDGEEVIKMAGNMHLALPMDESPDEADDDTEEETGHNKVHYFNPEYSGKPHWMEAPIKDPLEAISEWIEMKSVHCFKRAHLDGVVGQRIHSEAESGLKLRYAYKQLYRVLSRKSDNIVEGELSGLDLWLTWMAMEDVFGEIKIDRKKEFNIDELAIVLDNLYSSMRNVISKSFRVRTQNKIAQITLPDMTEKEFEEIKNENKTNTPDIPPQYDPDGDDPRSKTGRSGDEVRSALEARADHSKDKDKD